MKFSFFRSRSLVVYDSQFSILDSHSGFFFYLVQAERKKRPAPIPFLVRLSHCIGWNPTFLLPLTYYTTTLDSPPLPGSDRPFAHPITHSRIHTFTYAFAGHCADQNPPQFTASHCISPHRRLACDLYSASLFFCRYRHSWSSWSF